MPFDPLILNNESKNRRYEKQLERINIKTGHTNNIDETVTCSIQNIEHGCKSFVIYGEPQSGKTEMMIALTAKLLDHGKKIIIILLNDNVQLLNQNLDRFKRSGIDPTPKIYSDIINQSIDLKNSERIIFSKKNSRDLQKLIEIIGNFTGKIVIDDEADYASPNSKINQNEKTKINELVEKLIGMDGIYIGVTATPARLDLNNTFNNDNTKWVYFQPPPNYHGQNYFFPSDLKKSKLVKRLPDENDSKKYLNDAIFNFLINNAYLNIFINDRLEENYSMLVHTSGKKYDHEIDQKNIEETLDILSHREHLKNMPYYEKIWHLSIKKFPGNEENANRIIKFIADNINKSQVIVINSEHDKESVKGATSPSALFTFAVGGNIVSRGVTFDNLLTMFFSRDAKHKIQQDTYIQRARMFGYRGNYLDYFELYIPNKLYADWHKCFIYHKLSLELIKSKNGAPVWLEDRRISSAAKSSIDLSTVILYDESMLFGIFHYNEIIESIINQAADSNIDKLYKIHELIGEKALPICVIEFIKNSIFASHNEIALHASGSMKNYRDVDPDTITRSSGGIFSGPDYNKFPNAVHHIKIFYMPEGNARLYYKYRPGAIKFLLNPGKSDV